MIKQRIRPEKLKGKRVKTTFYQSIVKPQIWSLHQQWI